MTNSITTFSRIFIGVAALLATTACATNVRYEPPSVPTQTTYIAPLPASFSDVSSGNATEPAVRIRLDAGANSLPAEWWTIFHSPQLDELVRRGIANNLTLARAQAHIAAANARIKEAQGQLMPQVDATASVQRTSFGAPTLGPEAKTFPVFSAYSIGPTVSYNPDVFGGLHDQVELNQSRAQNAAAQLDAAKLTVAGNVALDVIRIALLQAQLKVLQGIVENDQHDLRLVQAARQTGGISDIDVESSQSQLDHDSTLLPPMQRQLNETQDALAVLTGIAPSDFQALEVPLDGMTLPTELPLVVPSELVRRRPDIVAAESNLHAASAAIGIATSNLYPQVNLSATFGPAGLLSHGPTEAAWTLLGGISAPIFHGGSLRAERDATEHDYDASIADYHQTVLEAFAQVADSIYALTTDEASFLAQAQAMKSATRSLDLTTKGYRVGNAGYIQVLIATRLEAEAQLGEVQASAQRYVDTVDLILATGGGLASAK